MCVAVSLFSSSTLKADPGFLDKYLTTQMSVDTREKFFNNLQALVEDPAEPCKCDCDKTIADMLQKQYGAMYPYSVELRGEKTFGEDYLNDIRKKYLDENFGIGKWDPAGFDNFHCFMLQINSCQNAIREIRIEFPSDARLSDMKYIYNNVIVNGGYANASDAQKLKSSTPLIIEGSESLNGGTLVIPMNINNCESFAFRLDMHNIPCYKTFKAKISIIGSNGRIICGPTERDIWFHDPYTGGIITEGTIQNATSNIEFTLNSLKNINNLAYKVYDMQGNLVSDGTTNVIDSKVSIPHNLKQGNYTISFQNEGTINSFKFIIK